MHLYTLHIYNNTLKECACYILYIECAHSKYVMSHFENGTFDFFNVMSHSVRDQWGRVTEGFAVSLRTCAGPLGAGAGRRQRRATNEFPIRDDARCATSARLVARLRGGVY